MGAIASQITSLTIAYSIVCSDADQRKHQSSASLAFVRGIHRRPVNSLHKWPVTRKMFPFDDVIMDNRKLMTCRSTNVLPGRPRNVALVDHWWAQPKCGYLYASSIVESGQSYRPRKVMYPTNDITATCMVLLVTCPRVNYYIHISIWSHPYIGNKNVIFALVRTYFIIWNIRKNRLCKIMPNTPDTRILFH